MNVTGTKPRLSHVHALDLLSRMIRIRRFEDKCAELYTQEKIRGFLHLYDGEEAIAVGVIPVLTDNDRVVATYREHAHALERGVPMNEVMAEMFGKAEGCSGGRGGSMHLFSSAVNFYGGNAIVSGGLPLVVGLALADKMRNEDRDKAEVEEWRKKGPIVRFQTWLEQNGMIHVDDIERIEQDIAAEVGAAVAFAEAGT